MALEGGEGSVSRPGRSLPPGKTRNPLYRRLGGPQGLSGQVWKISPPPEFDPRTVQPVASHYTTELPGPHMACRLLFIISPVRSIYLLGCTTHCSSLAVCNSQTSAAGFLCVSQVCLVLSICVLHTHYQIVSNS